MKPKINQRVWLYCLALLLLLLIALNADASARRRRKPRPKSVPVVRLPVMPIGMTPSDRAMLLQSFTDEEIIVERRKRLLEMYTAEELTAEYEKRGLRTDE